MAEDRNAELQRRINDEMIRFGQILPHTREELIEQETGVKDFNKIMESGTRALGGLKDVVGSTIASAYRGEQGAKAFNGAVDGVTKAADGAGDMLIKMGGPIGITVGILLKVVGKLGELAKAVAEQADAEYKTYQQLAKAGGATADGLTDIFNASQKLGIGVDGMQDYAAMFANYAKDLSTMSGSVKKGRAQFEDMIGEMEPFRLQLQNAGISQEEQNEGGLEYLKLMTQLNRTRGKTSKQLAEDYKEYLIQEDKLTKATGVTRKEREAAQRSALAEQRFAATLQKLRNEGNGEEAKRLEDFNKMLESTNPEAAKGMRAAAAGFLDSEDAQKFTRSTLGEGMSIIEKVQKGTMADAEGVGQINNKIADTYNMMGVQLGKIERNDSLLLSTTSARQAMLVKDQGITAAMEKSAAEGIKQGIETGEALDQVQQNTSKRIIAQQKTMLNTQAAMQKGVATAASAMKTVAEASAKAAEKLAAISGAKPTPAKPLPPGTVPGGTGTPSRQGRPPSAPPPPPPAPAPPPPPPPPAPAPPPPPPAPKAAPAPAPPPPAKSVPGGGGKREVPAPVTEQPAEASPPPAPPSGAPKEKIKPSTEPLVKKISPTEGIKTMLAELERQGIVDPTKRAAIMAQAAVETGGFQFLSENLGYSVDGLKKTFGRVKGVSDATLKDAISLGVAGIGELLYGGSPDSPSYKFGVKNLGNTEPGDGAKFRGRGFIQLTGRANYQRAGAADNPESLLDINTAAKTAVDFANRFKGNFADVKAFTQYVNGGQSHVAEREEYYKKYLNDMPRAARGGIFQAQGARRSSKSSGFEIPLKDGAVPVNIIGGMLDSAPNPDLMSKDAMPKLSTTITKNITEQMRVVAQDVIKQMKDQPAQVNEMDAAVAAKLQLLARGKQKANTINSRLLRVSMN